MFVFVDTFFEWVEAYSTVTEKTTEVAKLLLKEIVFKLELLYNIQRENGSLFNSEISQKIRQTLKIQ